MRKIKYFTQNKAISVFLFYEKQKRYENSNEKSVFNNKLFWKNVKPFLSDNEIHLLENNELVKTDLETAEVLNNFFSKVVPKSRYFKNFK